MGLREIQLKQECMTLVKYKENEERSNEGRKEMGRRRRFKTIVLPLQFSWNRPEVSNLSLYMQTQAANTFELEKGRVDGGMDQGKKGRSEKLEGALAGFDPLRRPLLDN